jgi:hypothetical protein
VLHKEALYAECHYAECRGALKNCIIPQSIEILAIKQLLKRVFAKFFKRIKSFLPRLEEGRF